MTFKKLNLTEAKKLALESYSFSKNSKERKDFIERYEDGYKKYLMYTKDREDALKTAKQQWRSNLFVPLAFTMVETWTPHVVLSIIESDPIISMDPENRDDYERAKIAQKLTVLQDKEDSGRIKFENMVREAGIGGLASGVEAWYVDKIDSMQVVEKSILGFKWDVEIPQKSFRFNGPRFTQLDQHDYYPDISKDNIEDMRFCMREFVLYEDEVEKMFEAGIFNEADEWKKYKKEKVDSTDDIARGVQRRLQEFVSSVKGVTGLKTVLIKEYMENDRLIYLLNDNYVMRNTNNPNWHKRKHFLDIRATPLPHKYYSYGLVWAVSPIQNAINDLYNQKSDNVKFLLNNMVVVVDNEIIYKSDLIPRPGGQIRVESDTNAVKPLVLPNVTQDAYAQQAELMEMSQNATGIFNIIKGEMGRRETATVGSILARAAGARLQLAIMRMAETFIKRKFMLMVELDRQYLTDERMLERVGEEDAEGIPEFRYVSRINMPQGKINYTPQVTLEQKKDTDRKSSLDYYNLLYGKPEFDQYALAESVAHFIPYKSKTSILLTKKDYTERMDRMAKQQEGMEMTGDKGNVVVPPVMAGEARSHANAPVRNQNLSPEIARRKEGMGPGREQEEATVSQ